MAVFAIFYALLVHLEMEQMGEKFVAFKFLSFLITALPKLAMTVDEVEEVAASMLVSSVARAHAYPIFSAHTQVLRTRSTHKLIVAHLS